MCCSDHYGDEWNQTDRDRAAAERDSLPLISGSPVFNTAACHSVSTSRVAEQIKSHLRAWTGTIRRCVKLPDSKLNYFRRKYRAAPNILHSAVFWPQTPDGRKRAECLSVSVNGPKVKIQIEILPPMKGGKGVSTKEWTNYRHNTL
ncbi:hypothetical protein EYF80_011903 [Liparis tanakae]|uniref:Uncharacterized protein n=1 Tax=Liparis tanakae TaxID=230148 RepID=A0A4Z2IIR8_9TELE|nr:hypothetical protein EYF80_011903 [Liparis tanakae]